LCVRVGGLGAPPRLRVGILGLHVRQWRSLLRFFFSSRRRHTISVSAFLLNRSSDLFLGTINPDTNKIPKHLFQGYLNIYNNYFKAPWMPDRTEANPNELNQDDARYGFRCCHLK